MPNYYLVIALMLSIIFGGYEHYSFKQYRTEVEALGKQAEIKNQQIIQSQAIATKGVEDAYKSKIDAIRSDYDRMRNSSSGAMSTIPNTTIRLDDPASNWILAQQCTETTQQLVSLQDWINLQVGIK